MLENWFMVIFIIYKFGIHDLRLLTSLDVSLSKWAMGLFTSAIPLDVLGGDFCWKHWCRALPAACCFKSSTVMSAWSTAAVKTTQTEGNYLTFCFHKATFGKCTHITKNKFISLAEWENPNFSNMWQYISLTWYVWYFTYI